MTSRGNTLKLTAVSALVVLTLTGFSTGRGHGGNSGDGGGGGCSSSDQNHDSSGTGGSHRDYDDDDDYGDTGAGSGGSSSGTSASSSLQDATVELLTCASKKTPYATVEVTNPNTVAGTFTVTVTFENGTGGMLASRTQTVDVPAGDTATARVDAGDGADVTRVAECDPDPYAPAAR
ncbi:hypothetical protein [Streptomyces marokkonensis]|uniref:hypothetical protein n=1 Tax=Streptomyces marokkonensis TaxID=324855 RepID=UPI0011F3003F|nr:hypothetical protein [Streptomyces marokkonensis]